MALVYVKRYSFLMIIREIYVKVMIFFLMAKIRHIYIFVFMSTVINAAGEVIGK